MIEDAARVLMRYYALTQETACEVFMELRDTRSILALAGYRGCRAVPASTAHDL